jgi:hypothetical protein
VYRDEVIKPCATPWVLFVDMEHVHNFPRGVSVYVRIYIYICVCRYRYEIIAGN